MTVTAQKADDIAMSTTGQLSAILNLQMLLAVRRMSLTARIAAVFKMILSTAAIILAYETTRRLPPEVAGLADLCSTCLLVGLLVVGIPGAWRLVTDRQWPMLLLLLPFSPRSTLLYWCAVRCARAGLGGLVFGAFRWGITPDHSLRAASILLSSVVSVAVLFGVLQVLIVLLARVAARRVNRVLLVALLLAIVSPALLGAHETANVIFSWDEVFQRANEHPLSRALGLVTLVRLCETDATALNWLLGLGGVLLRVLVCVIGAYTLLRTFTTRLAHAGDETESRVVNICLSPIRRVLFKTQTAWLLQSCLQLLTQLKQIGVILPLCALGSFAIVAGIPVAEKQTLTTVEVYPLLAVTLGMIVGSDGVSEILGRQWPFTLYRLCGASPSGFAVGVAVSASCLSGLIALACSPLLFSEGRIGLGAPALASAVILSTTEAVFASLISLYNYPDYWRLGFFGKLKVGIQVLASAWAVVVLFATFPGLPLFIVLVLWYERRRLGNFVLTRIWNAGLL